MEGSAEATEGGSEAGLAEAADGGSEAGLAEAAGGGSEVGLAEAAADAEATADAMAKGSIVEGAAPRIEVMRVRTSVKSER